MDHPYFMLDVSHYRYRQYGLWDRYTDVHPEFDQTFTIGSSNPKTDWFFAHVDRCFPHLIICNTKPETSRVNIIQQKQHKSS